MKQFKLIAVTALLAAIVGCSGEEAKESSFIPEIQVSVVKVQNRAAGASTDNLANLGLFVTNAASAENTYDNVQITRTLPADIWKSGSTKMYWQNATQPVSVLAYTPYQKGNLPLASATAVSVSVALDQSTVAGTIASDFLLQKKVAFIPGTDLVEHKIPLQLSHRMSKLNITIEIEGKDGALPESNPLTEIIVEGTRTAGVCDFTVANPAVVVKAGATPFGITPYVTDYSSVTGIVSAEALLVPQEMEANTLKVCFSFGGVLYEWVHPYVISFGGNTQYNLKLKIDSKDLIIVGPIVIVPWEEGEVIEGEFS